MCETPSSVFSCKILAKWRKMCYTVGMIEWKLFKNKRICVAISGGEDSVALLHYLKSLQEAYEFFLIGVHCEHGIRGKESLEDMRFVEEFCKKLDVPLYTFSADCPARAKKEKISLETAARSFRYESFSSLLDKGKADFIATAHHSGDEAETVLFRLARGTSLSGMAAMKEQSGYFIRPILTWSKEEIHRYIEDNQLAFRVDSTNFALDATRNKIRLEVLPRLENAVEGAIENIARFATLAAEDDELLYELSQSLIVYEGESIKVSFSDKKPLFTRAALTALKALGLGKDYTSAHLNALFDLQKLERGAYLTLPKNIRAEKGEKSIVFSLFQEENLPILPEREKFSEEGFDGGRYEVKLSYQPIMAAETPWRVLRIDKDKLPQDSLFRFREEGDEIRRFGGGKKSLKKFFNEEKIPPKERAYLPLIAKGNEVYVVCGVEISELVKVDENTKNVLYIVMQKKEKENGKA